MTAGFPRASEHTIDLTLGRWAGEKHSFCPQEQTFQQQ
jgi:hypothetical protein